MVVRRIVQSLLLPGMILLAASCGSSGGGFRRIGDGGASDGAGGPGDGPPGGSDLVMAVDLSTPVDLTVIPDLSVPCFAGRYSGPLKATATVGGAPLAFSGTIALTLGAPQNGVLPIVTGRMNAATNGDGGIVTATAMLAGSLDCDQRTLVNGMLVNGIATVFGMGVPITGTFTGDYDAGNHAFVNGTLTTMIITGNGTWSAAYLGP